MYIIVSTHWFSEHHLCAILCARAALLVLSLHCAAGSCDVPVIGKVHRLEGALQLAEGRPLRCFLFELDMTCNGDGKRHHMHPGTMAFPTCPHHLPATS